jgi:enterochelin esterase-like enzyme
MTLEQFCFRIKIKRGHFKSTPTDQTAFISNRIHFNEEITRLFTGGNTMKLKWSLWFGIAVIVFLSVLLYWYVFVEGAPQFDAPAIVQSKDLSFQVQTFNSKAMGTTRRYGIILPPNYEQHPQQRYPVIFLLHGGHDNERAFYDKYALTSVLEKLYRQGQLPPSILISPDGNDNRGSSPIWDPQYFNGSNGNVGTLIGSELPQVIRSRYRTLNEPRFWAMGGVSSGGWGAYNIGLRYLNYFHIFFSHSGYFMDNSGAENSPNQFIQEISTAQRRMIRAYLDAGQSDTDLLASTQQFHQTLEWLGVANEFYAFPGGHGLTGADFGWNYFHKHLADSLSYVGKQFDQAGMK